MRKCTRELVLNVFHGSIRHLLVLSTCKPCYLDIILRPTLHPAL